MFGARLVVARPEGHKDPQYLVDVIQREKITTLHFVPSMLSVFVETEGVSACHSLRRIICSGEALSVDLNNRVLERLHTELHNLYGPTETAVDVTWWVCRPNDTLRSIPIGRPIANTWLYILDQRMQPVPIGIAGELHIGGIQVGKGYLNRPELNTEKFIANPFGTGKLYKTGDLARWLPDGNIEYLGRMDHQIKLRGFRIELGEIEYALAQHPDVRENVVVAHEDISGDKSLIAYIVSSSGKPIEISNLRTYLNGKLPEYMIPSVFVFLKALPLSPNGKVDRRALPAPDASLAVRGYVAPRTFSEEILAAIWAEVLKLEQVGIYDNFFEMGGHSLLASKLVSRIHEYLKVDFPLRKLFDAPTIEQMAETIENIQANGAQNDNDDEEWEKACLTDTVLNPNISFDVPYEFIHHPRSLFLTGATGFLGSHLLGEILQHTEADVYCLVRAKDIEEGRQRVIQKLKENYLWQDTYVRRIFPVAGDIGSPHLGIHPAEWEHLAQTVDAIYHCAAWVNFTYPYRALKPANVDSVQELINLALQTRMKPFHHISTLSVVDSFPASMLVTENIPLDNGTSTKQGYARSKWVAEKLLLQAREKGLLVSIHRPGLIGGHSQTGVSNNKDFVWALVKGCIQLGLAPDTFEGWILTPVDTITDALLYISGQPNWMNKNFHYMSRTTVPWSDIVRWLQAYGYKLDILPVNQWVKALLRQTEQQDNALHPFLPMLTGSSILAQQPNTQEWIASPEIDCQNFEMVLAELSRSNPVMEQGLFETYLKYLIGANYLPQPTSSPTSL
jgi:thioester reductase-like protein